METACFLIRNARCSKARNEKKGEKKEAHAAAAVRREGERPPGPGNGVLGRAARAGSLVLVLR